MRWTPLRAAPSYEPATSGAAQNSLLNRREHLRQGPRLREMLQLRSP